VYSSTNVNGGFAKELSTRASSNPSMKSQLRRSRGGGLEATIFIFFPIRKEEDQRGGTNSFTLQNISQFYTSRIMCFSAQTRNPVPLPAENESERKSKKGKKNKKNTGYSANLVCLCSYVCTGTVSTRVIEYSRMYA